jgi:hypothetical protein
MSPRKYYGGVKSKVAGNINTQKQTRKTKRLGEPSPDREQFVRHEVETMFASSPGRTRAMQMNVESSAHIDDLTA